MRKRKLLPFIPLQNVDKGAAYANYQYLIPKDEVEQDDRQHTRFFRETILKLLYCNFHYSGLTEEQSHAIEYYLITTGKVCAVRSYFNPDTHSPDGLFFGSYTSVDSPMYSFYGRPTAGACTGRNGTVIKAATSDDYVIGFDSKAYDNMAPMTSPLIGYVDYLAAALSDAYEAWRVAAESRKCGSVYVAPNKTIGDIIRAALRKISDNNAFVVIDHKADNLAEDPVQPYFAPQNTDALEDYHDHYINMWSYVLDLLGMENTPQSKKERLVVDEVHMNRSLSRYLSGDRLQARKDFVTEINKKMGTHIEVENYLAQLVEEDPNGAVDPNKDPNKDGDQNE